MAKRFLNATEERIVALVKRAMLRHKPPTGFKRALLDAVRYLSTGLKPRDAHSLSVLVTQDLLTEVADEFGTMDVSSSFMNVMALSDEEVLKHYENRSPFFVGMLLDAKKKIRRGVLTSKDWGLNTFVDFVEGYITERDLGTCVDTEHLRQALEIFWAPGSYRLLSVNWMLMRLIAAGYITVVAHAKVHPWRKNMKKKHLKGADNLIMRDLFHHADTRTLEETLHREKWAMVSMYGALLLGAYVNEISLEVAEAFKQENRGLSLLLRTCTALLMPIGSVSLAFYASSMISSIIDQWTRPASSSVYCSILNDTAGIDAANHTGLSRNVTSAVFDILNSSLANFKNGAGTQLLAEIFNKQDALNTVVSTTCHVAAAALSTSATNVLSQVNETISVGIKSILLKAFGDEYSCKSAEEVQTWDSIVAASTQAMKLSNMSAAPASLSMLVVMYLSLPLIGFSEYVSRWSINRTASRGKNQAFVAPRKITLLSGVVCIKLALNTFLYATPHFSNELFTAVLAWSLIRLYLPLSLIEQPYKTAAYFNTAASAASSSRHVRIELDGWKCVAAALISVPFEYLGHILTNLHMINGVKVEYPWKEVITGYVFIVKCARIAAMFAPVYLGRKSRGHLPYSYHFEKMFWADGFKAITAPPCLILIDAAAGSQFYTTLVLAGDTLISIIPDMVCGASVAAMNKTGAKLAALESFVDTTLHSEDTIVKLASITAMESLPGSACGVLEKVLEQHCGKDIVKDLGMDLIVDGFGNVREGEEQDAEKDRASRRTTVRQVGTSRPSPLSPDMKNISHHGSAFTVVSSGKGDADFARAHGLLVDGRSPLPKSHRGSTSSLHHSEGVAESFANVELGGPSVVSPVGSIRREGTGFTEPGQHARIRKLEAGDTRLDYESRDYRSFGEAVQDVLEYDAKMRVASMRPPVSSRESRDHGPKEEDFGSTNTLSRSREGRSSIADLSNNNPLSGIGKVLRELGHIYLKRSISQNSLGKVSVRSTGGSPRHDRIYIGPVDESPTDELDAEASGSSLLSPFIVEQIRRIEADDARAKEAKQQPRRSLRNMVPWGKKEKCAPGRINTEMQYVSQPLFPSTDDEYGRGDITHDAGSVAMGRGSAQVSPVYSEFAGGTQSRSVSAVTSPTQQFAGAHTYRQGASAPHASPRGGSAQVSPIGYELARKSQQRSVSAVTSPAQQFYEVNTYRQQGPSAHQASPGSTRIRFSPEYSDAHSCLDSSNSFAATMPTRFFSAVRTLPRHVSAVRTVSGAVARTGDAIRSTVQAQGPLPGSSRAVHRSTGAKKAQRGEKRLRSGDFSNTSGGRSPDAIYASAPKQYLAASESARYHSVYRSPGMFDAAHPTIDDFDSRALFSNVGDVVLRGVLRDGVVSSQQQPAHHLTSVDTEALIPADRYARHASHWQE